MIFVPVLSLTLYAIERDLTCVTQLESYSYSGFNYPEANQLPIMIQCGARSKRRERSKHFYSLSSDSSFFDFVFLFSFFSFFLRFRSDRSSAVSPSCLFRFLDFSSSLVGDAGDASAGFSVVIVSFTSSTAPETVLVGSTLLVVVTVKFSNGALKSLYSAFHLAGVLSLGLPYFYEESAL